MIYFIFILGTFFGSFFLVVANRGVLGEDFIFKRSYCDNCKQTLKWYNLVPIVSFLFQKGRCSMCNKKISYECILIELLTGALFAFCFYNYGYTFNYDFFVSIVLSSLFVIICITDFKKMIILNSPLVVSILCISGFMLYYKGFEFLLVHLAYGLAIFIFFLLIKLVGDIVASRESMGGGDIKFSFIIGFSLGVIHALYAVILSAFLALPTSIACVYLTKNKEVPYGPFLAGALLIVYFNIDKFPLFFI